MRLCEYLNTITGQRSESASSNSFFTQNPYAAPAVRRISPMSGKAESKRFSTVSPMDFGIHFPVVAAKDEVLDDGRVCILTVAKEKWVRAWFSDKLRQRCTLFHPHCLKIYDVLLSGDKAHVIFEHPNGENLLDFLTENSATESFARNLFQQLIFTVDYLHHMGITGMDLSLERVLYDSQNGVLKLIDFGLDSSILDGSSILSLPYVSPEQLSHVFLNQEDRKASDIWRCGVLLYCILFRTFPFPADGLTTDERILNTLNGHWKAPTGYVLSAACMDMLRKMLTRDPRQRITVEGIKKHAWYKKSLPEGVSQYEFLNRPRDGLLEKIDHIAKVDLV